MKNILLFLFACLSLGVSAQELQRDTFKTASGKDVVITCIKHATMQIKYDGRYFYIDPVSTFKPVTDFTTMPVANYIIITHEHPDHYERTAIGQLTRPQTITYCNPAVARLLPNVMSMENGDSVAIGSDVTLKAVPAYNTTPGREQFHPKGRDNGYVLTIDGLRIYIAGDTEDIPEMAQLKNIDVGSSPAILSTSLITFSLALSGSLLRSSPNR